MIQHNVPLHNKNWFGTGGPAAYFAQPTNTDEFHAVAQWAQQHGIPTLLLGAGANCLIADTGYAGLIIRPALATITHNTSTSTVTAGAGVHMHDLINFCLEHQLIGLEEFSGIPGTVGGSVYINLHYFDFLLEQFLISAQLIERATGQLITVDRAWFEFGYNYSRLHEGAHWLANATFQLKSATNKKVAYARGRRDEIIRHRTRRYPNKRTCGSFFRNFMPEEVHLHIQGKPMIHVAYYLDKLGIKGNLSVGDAHVSWQHANMLVNGGNASTHDIIMLARTIQDRMFDQYGIMPQPECRLIGFDAYPLLAVHSYADQMTASFATSYQANTR